MSARPNEIRGAIELKTSSLRGSAVNNSYEVDVQNSGSISEKVRLDNDGTGADYYALRKRGIVSLDLDAAATFFTLPTPTSATVVQGVATIRLAILKSTTFTDPTAIVLHAALKYSGSAWTCQIMTRQATDGTSQADAQKVAGSYTSAIFSGFANVTTAANQNPADMPIVFSQSGAALQVAGNSAAAIATNVTGVSVLYDVDIMLSPL